MKLRSIFAAASIALVFASCQDSANFAEDELQILNNNTAISTVNAEAVVSNVAAETASDVNLEDVDLITDESLEHLFSKLEKGRFGRLDCAEITVDSASNIMTVDFGDGCEDHHGVLRSGKIIIEHNGIHHAPGSYRTVTFENFAIDSVLVEGTRTMANVTDTSANDGLEVFVTTLTGGKITYNDTTVITRDSEFTRTIYPGDSLTASYSTMTGGASGQLSDGTEYTATITTAIVMTRECNLRVPVSGVKEFVAGETTIVVDYGDGTCDNLADVTTNGVTETVELDVKEIIQGHSHGDVNPGAFDRPVRDHAMDSLRAGGPRFDHPMDSLLAGHALDSLRGEGGMPRGGMPLGGDPRGNGGRGGRGH